MVHNALEAAEKLASDGPSVEVVDLRTLVPLDLETIKASVAKTRRLIVAHSATGFGGFGGEIAALVGEQCFGALDAPIRRVAAAYTPVPRADLLAFVHQPSADSIAAAAREIAG